MGQTTIAVVLTAGCWRSAPLLVPRGFRQRLAGMRGVPPGWGVLLRTASVHTFGMRRPVVVIGISGSGGVRWARPMPPGRVVFDPGSTWIAELPGAAAGPPSGPALRVVPILDRWPGL
ncbi:MAG: hypothetical protein KJ698_05325 [Actinobacteria bacterium]|nr:hypothetical protein [Actinomycetota bacterium]